MNECDSALNPTFRYCFSIVNYFFFFKINNKIKFVIHFTASEFYYLYI